MESQQPRLSGPGSEAHMTRDDERMDVALRSDSCAGSSGSLIPLKELRK